MTVETQYNVVKVNELREITVAQGVDQLIINDIDSSPLETKKITAENLALSIKDYILPIASEDVLGGVKIGHGLTINPITGVLSNDIFILDDLDDVIILNAEAGHILRYNGVQWVNEEEGGITNIIAGNGLSGGGYEGDIILHVNAGPGLSIINDVITVNVNAGLEILNDAINVRLNSGLTFTDNRITPVPGVGLNISNNAINFVPGFGLIQAGPGIKVDEGKGLKFEDNKLTVVPGANLEYDTNYNISARYAEEAKELEGQTSYPGVVSLESIGGTVAGTSTTTAATPMGVMKSIYERFMPVRPDPLKVTVTVACYPEEKSTTATVPIDTKQLVLSGQVDALTDEDKPALGTWEFYWYDVTNPSAPILLDSDPYPESNGSLNCGISWNYFVDNDFIITPVTGSRKIRLDVVFRDVFGMEYTAQSDVVNVIYKNAMKITTQPNDIDTTATADKNVQKSSTVVVEPYDAALPWDSSKLYYRWSVWDKLITDKNDPDLDYDFADWQTNSLKITRTGDAGILLQIACDIFYDENPDDFPTIDDTQGVERAFELRETPAVFAEDQKDVKKRNISSEYALVTAPVQTITKQIIRQTNTVTVAGSYPSGSGYQAPRNVYTTDYTRSRIYYKRNGVVYGSRARYTGKRN